MVRSLCLAILLASCGGKKPPQEIQEVSLGVTLKDDYPKFLSEWGLFDNMTDFISPSRDAFLYEINSPLFSDYAHKARFIRLPENSKIGYDANEVLDFPDESILVKHFYYPKDFNAPEQNLKILETRLLIKKEDEWDAIVYQWNDEQTEAERLVLGAEVPVEWTDQHGELQRINYSIPSQPQCKSCHEFNGKLVSIGPTIRQLNRGEQLSSWSARGLIDLPSEELPRLADYENESEILDSRARAWLEINCAHCHRKEGPAKNTGLYLLASEKEPYRLGVNKPPVAAGRGSANLKFGIVPGNPNESILVHRIETMEPGEMMPELGRKMQHVEGIALIRKWIEEMN